MALAQITQKLAADRAEQEAAHAQALQKELAELTNAVNTQTLGTEGWDDAKKALDNFHWAQTEQTKHAAATLGISVSELKIRQEQNKKITDMKDALTILHEEITAAGGDPTKNEEYKRKSIELQEEQRELAAKNLVGLEADRYRLEQMQIAIEAAGGQAKDNLEYNKLSSKIQWDELQLRKSQAETPAAKEEIRREELALKAKQGDLLAKMSLGITGMWDNMKEKGKKYGKGLLTILGTTLLGGFLVWFGKWLNDGGWDKMVKWIKDNPIKTFAATLIGILGTLMLAFKPLLLWKGAKKLGRGVAKMASMGTNVVRGGGAGAPVGGAASRVGGRLGGVAGRGAGAMGGAGGGWTKSLAAGSKNIGKAMKSIGKGAGMFFQMLFKGLAKGLSFLGNPKVLLGVGALTILSAAVWIFSKAMEAFSNVTWKAVAVGIVTVIAFGALAVAASFFAPLLFIGAAAIGAVGVALIPFAAAAKIAEGPLGKFGNIFKQLAKVPFENLALAGPALAAMAVGFTALSAGGLMAGIADAFTNLFASDPITKLERIAKAAPGIDLIGKAFGKFGTHLNTFLTQVKGKGLEFAAEGISKIVKAFDHDEYDDMKVMAEVFDKMSKVRWGQVDWKNIDFNRMQLQKLDEDTVEQHMKLIDKLIEYQKETKPGFWDKVGSGVASWVGFKQPKEVDKSITFGDKSTKVIGQQISQKYSYQNIGGAGAFAGVGPSLQVKNIECDTLNVSKVSGPKGIPVKKLIDVGARPAVKSSSEEANGPKGIPVKKLIDVEARPAVKSSSEEAKLELGKQLLLAREKYKKLDLASKEENAPADSRKAARKALWRQKRKVNVAERRLEAAIYGRDFDKDMSSMRRQRRLFGRPSIEQQSLYGKLMTNVAGEGLQRTTGRLASREKLKALHKSGVDITHLGKKLTGLDASGKSVVIDQVFRKVITDKILKEAAGTTKGTPGLDPGRAPIGEGVATAQAIQTNLQSQGQSGSPGLVLTQNTQSNVTMPSGRSLISSKRQAAYLMGGMCA